MSRKLLAIVVALLTASFAWSAEDGTSSAAEQPGSCCARSAGSCVSSTTTRPPSATRPKRNCSNWPAPPPQRPIDFLELLPEDNDQMPLAVRDRLTNIRHQVEDRIAKSAVVGTKLTLSAKEMPLGEVFAAIEKQTGNRLIDNRQENAAEPAELSGKITIELKDEPSGRPSTKSSTRRISTSTATAASLRCRSFRAAWITVTATAAPATPVRSDWK